MNFNERVGRAKTEHLSIQSRTPSPTGADLPAVSDSALTSPDGFKFLCPPGIPNTWNIGDGGEKGGLGIDKKFIDEMIEGEENFIEKMRTMFKETRRMACSL